MGYTVSWYSISMGLYIEVMKQDKRVCENRVLQGRMLQSLHDHRSYFPIVERTRVISASRIH